MSFTESSTCAECDDTLASSPYDSVIVHSLAWLFVGNAVGLLLAALLLFPQGGAALAPLTYGRWIPVHLNAQLYGWCSVPLLGLLFRLYLPASGLGRWPGRAVAAWSGALIFASVSWLAGHSSGKLFMEWSGPSLIALVASMLFLSGVLFAGFVQQYKSARGKELQEPGWLRGSKLVLLMALACIPFVMYWAADPAIYPSINPHSGGSTGGSLLGSTLVVVGIIWGCPLILGLPVLRDRKTIGQTLLLLVAHFVWFGMLDHGNRSHHELVQIVSLSSLMIWLPLLVRYLRIFRWPDGTRIWLLAFCGWAAFLLSTALLTFMPGVLERWKFTNALVSHVHLAMAGMLTSFNVLVLMSLGANPGCRTILSARVPFVSWHAGCLLMVCSLMALGMVEASNQGLLYRSSWSTDAFYVLRLLAGLLMFKASAWWLVKTIRLMTSEEPEMEEARL